MPCATRKCNNILTFFHCSVYGHFQKLDPVDIDESGFCNHHNKTNMLIPPQETQCLAVDCENHNSAGFCVVNGIFGAMDITINQFGRCADCKIVTLKNLNKTNSFTVV